MTVFFQTKWTKMPKSEAWSEIWSEEASSLSCCLPGTGCTYIFRKPSQSAMVSKPHRQPPPPLKPNPQFSLEIVICRFYLSVTQLLHVSLCFVCLVSVWDGVSDLLIITLTLIFEEYSFSLHLWALFPGFKAVLFNIQMTLRALRSKN